MIQPSSQKVALVTGANRGLGLEACRQLAEMGIRVVLSSRNAESGSHAAARLDPSGQKIRACQLDVANEESVKQALDFIKNHYGRLDILINNAGVGLDADGGYDPSDGEGGTRQGHTILNIPKEKLMKTLEINTVGAVLVSRIFIPLMQKNNYGRIVNVSSQMGQLESMGTDWPAYRISKAALNAVTRILAQEMADYDILVNSVHPGWVRTDMGGPNAPKTVSEGVATILWAATLPIGSPTGLFFKDKEPIAW